MAIRSLEAACSTDYFHVLVTLIAVRFETFVILSRHARFTHGANSHLFADCLIAFQFVRLMFFETRTTSKISVTGLARDSFFCERTWRNRPALATRLSTLTRLATFTSIITAFAYTPSRYRPVRLFIT